MSKELLATLAAAAAILAVMWNISGEIGELRGAVNANTAAIAELRGIMIAHIGGHSHGSEVAVADLSLSPPLE
ncbi:MAG: hypothetical protein ACR2QC_00695 [Gammaproteobacteria bacterium]